MEQIQFICGTKEIQKKPVVPFDDLACEFLDDLSKRLRKSLRAKKYPEVQTFSYWCRKGNIQKLKRDYKTNGIRLGKGLIFHITPSNVPVNFAFSYVFGLLAGNGNVVRIPTKPYEQVSIICEEIGKLFGLTKYQSIKNQTTMISYEKENKEVTDYYSSLCDVRIIWGGDLTIHDIRRSELPPRSTEITFADRYSFGIISSESVENSTDKELEELAERFYNDTYLMDQNACSSPHLIVWYKEEGKDIQKQKERFWDCVYMAAAKYDFIEGKASEKYRNLCKIVMEENEISVNHRYGNLLTVIQINKLRDNMEECRGRYGIFYEYETTGLEDVFRHTSNKTQTLSYFGMNREVLRDCVMKYNLSGIDRIVPFGDTLDIGLIWDGYDIISQLSRIVCV
ncbi:MAG: hypothetical protein LBR68_01575 [Lachnoclostridium sp.]|jgi:hypothetical protein|nr:hypothetical protein [Lachnoclostridium sp.]